MPQRQSNQFAFEQSSARKPAAARRLLRVEARLESILVPRAQEEIKSETMFNFLDAQAFQMYSIAAMRFIAILLLSTLAFAKSPSHLAPMPQGISTAKSVFLYVETDHTQIHYDAAY